MKTIIETNRLYLRELNINDAENFYLLNANPEVLKYTGDCPFENIHEAKSFLQNYHHYELYGYGRWAVIRKADNIFLGWCGLKYSPDSNEVDIGFRFFTEYWNQGYATEAALECINYGFNILHIDQIVGRAMAQNYASIKVLEKIGMQYVGRIEFSNQQGVLYKISKYTTKKIIC